jgi:hypothetical protein
MAPVVAWAPDRLPTLPASDEFEAKDLFEVVQVLDQLLDRQRGLCAPLPVGPFQGADGEVVVANHLGVVLGEGRRQERLQFVLVHDEEVAAWAVAAGLVQGHGVQWIHMDHQGDLPLSRLGLALGTDGAAPLRVRVEEDAVSRRLLAEARWFRPGWHGGLLQSLLAQPGQCLFEVRGDRPVDNDRWPELDRRSGGEAWRQLDGGQIIVEVGSAATVERVTAEA